MKKLISALLILAMLVSMVCVSTSAAGVVFKADFSTMDTDQFYTQFMDGRFAVDDASGLLYGYYDAKALQTLYDDSTDEGVFKNTENTWLTYDASITLMVSDDDAVDDARCITIAYCNDNQRALGEVEKREFITLSYDIEKQQFDVCNNTMPVYNETTVIGEPIPMELPTNSEEFFTLGMSVDKNRVRFFVNNELLYDIDGTQYRVAESFNSPFFLWNGGNYMQIKELTIATAGYLYPYADDIVTDGTTAGDEPVDGTTAGGNTDVTTAAGNDDVDTTTVPVTTSEKVLQVTDAGGNAVTDENGQAVTSISIVTDPGPAATNTGKPAGGSSTATGDATFVVVAAMVATLGCALIVRKANAR